MRTKTLAGIALVIVALGSPSSWWTRQAEARRGDWNRWHAVVPAGTSFDVRLDSQISTEDANPGDTWSGSVSQSVYSGDRVVIPAGSPITGVVTSAAQG